MNGAAPTSLAGAEIVLSDPSEDTLHVVFEKGLGYLCGNLLGIEDHRHTLADELLRKGAILTAPVKAAFRYVPRHLFVPEVDPDRAYRDEVIPIEAPGSAEEVASSASQPAVVARMLEQLAIEPGDRILEVGTATGYNAALMAYLVGEGGRVVTVELAEALAHRARGSLAAVLEKGFGPVEVVHADGARGYPEQAPYDRIVVTVAAPDIAPAWRQQLAPGGRLAMPLELWTGLQVCVAFEPAEDRLGREHLASVAGAWCGFLSMGGELAQPQFTDQSESLGYLSEERADSRIAFEARLRGLRAASLATGLPFPEWLRIRAYPRELDYTLDSEEDLILEKDFSRLVLDQL